MCVFLSLQRNLSVSHVKIQQDPLPPEAGVTYRSGKSGLCCVEHKIDLDFTSISVISHQAGALWGLSLQMSVGTDGALGGLYRTSRSDSLMTGPWSSS